MSSFRCTLTLAGHDFPVLRCTYQFEQATTERGRATAKVRSGLITLHLDVPDSNQLLAWAMAPANKLSGHLVFFETNRPIAREKLTFEDAFCVSYDELFEAGAEHLGAYYCILQIAAAKLVLNTLAKDSDWAKTR